MREHLAAQVDELVEALDEVRAGAYGLYQHANGGEATFVVDTKQLYDLAEEIFQAAANVAQDIEAAGPMLPFEYDQRN